VPRTYARRTERLMAGPSAATAPSAIPRRFVCTQVRHALQHAVAIGACSPKLAATCEARSVAISFTDSIVNQSRAIVAKR
jgi:hypothetical protein